MWKRACFFRHLVILVPVFAIWGCKHTGDSAAAPSTEVKDLYIPESLAYRYYVEPSLENCHPYIAANFHKFPIWQEMSLKKVEDSAGADIRFVNRSNGYHSVEFEADSTLTVPQTPCGSDGRTEEQMMFRPVSMIMKLVKEQGNLRFAGKCNGVSYRDLDPLKNPNSRTGVYRVTYAVNGSGSVVPETGDVIGEMADAVNSMRDVSIQNVGGLGRTPHVYFSFQSMGADSEFSTSNYDSRGSRIVKLNSDRISAYPELQEVVMHEFFWTLYQLEVKSCKRIEIGDFGI